MNNEGGEGQEGEFDAKTFLYIRTHPADNGLVPLPAGLPFWISPDITIIRPGGIRGTIAVAGEADSVEVTVTNGGGIDAVDAYVEAFVADPSTAFTPATAKLVGGGFLTVPNHNTAAIAFPWTPTTSDAGHRCLLARVCLTFPLDCYANGAIFDVVGDRHVAQRNINVAKLEQELLSFGFVIVNPQKEGASQFLVKVNEVKIGRRTDLVRRALGCQHAQFAQVPLGGLALTVGEVLPPVGLSEAKDERAAFPIGVLRKPLELGRRKSGKMEMRYGERRYAVLTVARNPDIRPGDLSVVQVKQVDLKTKRTVGGLWLIVQH